jgi:hypothetical protein
VQIVQYHTKKREIFDIIIIHDELNRAPRFLRVIEPLGLLVACSIRAIGRSENPGVLVFYVVDIICPLVEIGLTDLPNSRVAMALTRHPRGQKASL